LLITYDVTLPRLIGNPYTPGAVPTYTLYPARSVVVTGSQVSVAVVVVVGDIVVAGVVVVGVTVKVTGMDVLPALDTVIAIVAE
jgi:hypothetical protein